MSDRIICPIMSTGLREGYDTDHWDEVECTQACGFYDHAVQQCSRLSTALALRDISAQLYMLHQILGSRS